MQNQGTRVDPDPIPPEGSWRWGGGGLPKTIISNPTTIISRPIIISASHINE